MIKTSLIMKNSGRLKPLSEKINQMKKTVDEEIFTQDIKVAEELNSFFSSIVKTLKIPECSVTNPLAEQLTNPVFKINTKL